MQYSTPKHDAILKYINQEKNRYKLLEFVAKQKGFEIDKDNSTSSFLAEVPIFSKNDTRRFIVEGIIDLYNTKNSSAPPNTTIQGQPYKNGLIMKSFSGKELHLIKGAIYRKIVYDIKPKLDSVSNALGQLKTYSHFLTYVRYYNGQKSTRLSEPDLTILTFDNDTSFDFLCKEQGVIIFHLSPNDIKG